MSCKWGMLDCKTENLKGEILVLHFKYINKLISMVHKTRYVYYIGI